MGYSRKPNYHFNSETEVIGDVPLNRTIVCNSFLGVPSVSFKYITSSSANTIKAAYEAGHLEPIKSVLSTSATYAGNLLGTHAATLKFFTNIYSGAVDEATSIELTLTGALDSQLILKDTNALWIEYTGSCTFDEALATYGIYLKERDATQTNTKYIYGCVSLENSSLTFSANIVSNAATAPSGDTVHGLAGAFGSYLIGLGITIDGFSANGVSWRTSEANFSRSTFQNNGSSGIFVAGNGTIMATYASFLNNGTTGFSAQQDSKADITGSTATGNGAQGIYAIGSYVEAKKCTVSGNTSNGVNVTSSYITLTSATIDNNGASGVYISQSTISASSLIVTNNTLTGLVGLGGSTLYTTSATLTGNGGHGAYISRASFATLENSTIDNNSDNGVKVDHGSSVTISSCNISNSGAYGVYLSNTSNAVAFSTNITNSGNYGVYATMGAYYYHEVGGSVTGNTTYDLAIVSGAYARTAAAVSYGNSNLTANTHYTDGSHLKIG